jgi:EAL domain-containing protein (putative c-di-GMP-specific phosphodiesterase class I)
LRTLQSLHRIGVQLTIDHFGRGGSSLTTLRNGPADHVKLDASLTGTVGFGDDSLFRSVVQLVHALAASVVAEHVTSASQHERLRTLGCDYLQGHHIGRPARAENFWAGVRSVGD